jgi:hypothetical protein
MSFFFFFFAAFDNMRLKYTVLACMKVVAKKLVKREGGSYNPIIEYERYSSTDGVHRMQMFAFQANFLEDKLSPDARLFYLAFAFVDGANEVGRHILSYVGRNKSEDEEQEGD